MKIAALVLGILSAVVWVALTNAGYGLLDELGITTDRTSGSVLLQLYGTPLVAVLGALLTVTPISGIGAFLLFGSAGYWLIIGYNIHAPINLYNGLPMALAGLAGLFAVIGSLAGDFRGRRQTVRILRSSLDNEDEDEEYVEIERASRPFPFGLVGGLLVFSVMVYFGIVRDHL